MKHLLRTTAVVLSILAVWEGIVRACGIPEYLVPGPVSVARVLLDKSLVVARASGVTLFEATLGLLAATFLTSVCAALFAVIPRTERIVRPITVALQSTPILAVAPLLTLWFGTGYGSKIGAAVIVCFFPLLAGWSSGIRSVDQQERDLLATMGASRWQVARYLTFPRALPFFFAGMKVSAPLSLLGAIVGEFVGASEGLGYQILSSSYYTRTPEMIACILIVSALGVSAHHLVCWIEKRVLFWHGAWQARTAPGLRT